MQDFETERTTPFPQSDDHGHGRTGSFTRARPASGWARLNGKAKSAHLKGFPAEGLRLCVPLFRRFYLVRLDRPKGAPAAEDGSANGQNIPPILLGANVLVGFFAAWLIALWALYGDAPFVYGARETAFFVLRQYSALRDILNSALSFSLF